MDNSLDENGMLLYINMGEELGLAKGPIAVIQLSTKPSPNNFCSTH
jgi:hypothetical protein